VIDPLFSLACILLVLSAIPALLTFVNLRVFLAATKDKQWLQLARNEKLSVLIPARDEAVGIGKTLDCILASKGIEFEVIVLDDQSEDSTAAIVQAKKSSHSNLELISGITLPSAWNGKQHACWRLAGLAKNNWLLFLDADVRVEPDALLRAVAEAMKSEADLVSGFPRQVAVTWSEKLLIPLMHFLLLGYLPISRMRRSKLPGVSAGCGQFFLARRHAYFESDGHRAIGLSRHDGVTLPRNFRKHGFRTDIFDAGDIASCRMYQSAGQVVLGLLKNADEGVGNPKLIGIFTVLLIGGAVLPAILLFTSVLRGWEWPTIIVLCAATCLSWLPRILNARRFNQAYWSAALHPVSVACFMALQYVAMVQSLLGCKVQWRGRD
jgi:glycosyltransferase involved in cell wall biosynthesis